ncbi:uncharacterized protein isoform X3 [Rhodnius prolixus]|uniref:uncharacterized protein isoform X3 n=1 Tax=Rhodnius prolixus TaxID=13249 RepID=UPI003D187DE0
MDFNDKPSNFIKLPTESYSSVDEECSDEMATLNDVEESDISTETREKYEEEEEVDYKRVKVGKKPKEELSDEEDKTEIDLLNIPKKPKIKMFKLKLLESKETVSVEEEKLEEAFDSGSTETLYNISASTASKSPSVSTAFRSSASLDTLLSLESFEGSEATVESPESSIGFAPSVKTKKKKKYFIKENKSLIPLRNEFEERDMLIISIRNSIVEEVVNKAFKRFQATLAVPFTVLCMHKAWRKLIYMYSFREEPQREDVSAKPWKPDKPSNKCNEDSWATNQMPIDVHSDVETDSEAAKKQDFDFLPIFTDELGMPLKSFEVKKPKGKRKSKKSKDSQKMLKKHHKAKEYGKKVSYKPTKRVTVVDSPRKQSRNSYRWSERTSLSSKSVATKLESFLLTQHQSFLQGHKSSLAQGRNPYRRTRL